MSLLYQIVSFYVAMTPALILIIVAAVAEGNINPNLSLVSVKFSKSASFRRVPSTSLWFVLLGAHSDIILLEPFMHLCFLRFVGHYESLIPLK